MGRACGGVSPPRTIAEIDRKEGNNTAEVSWRCIIDNTSLARLCGAGSSAVIVPEMREFARARGFEFTCHAIDHPNRKAGNERSVWSVETGFLPGRTFESLEDLNRQAFEWATVRMEQRVQTKARGIPAQLFEHERLYLHPLPEHLPAPYQVHQRVAVVATRLAREPLLLPETDPVVPISQPQALTESPGRKTARAP